MPDLFLTVDALKPSDHSIEQAYSLGPGPDYTPAPVLIDAAGDGEQASLLANSNTFAVWAYGGAVYKLLNRQFPPKATIVCKSLDGGATWSVLDEAGAPASPYGSGCFDGLQTLYCAFCTAASGEGEIHLMNFDLVTETWGAAYGTVGAPVAGGIVGGVWKRSNDTLLVFYNGRTTVTPTATGMGAVVYDLAGGSWGSPFDAGANLTALAGWSAATSAVASQATACMGADGVVHLFFNTSSFVVAPIWGNRCFYQAVNLDGSLGAFFDFPGQVAPFPPFPYNTQQLEAYEGSPLGTPVIVGDMLVLPVLMRNDSVIDRFPHQLANVYVGTPVSAPVWSLDTSATIDPGAILDDFIWPQQSPMAACDGTTLYCVFPAQDEDGQNFARLRLCQTSNLADPADPASWTAATVFDLQVDAPPGFQFPEQRFSTPAIAFSAAAAPLGITCDNPPAGAVGVAYSHSFPATGGTLPYVFSLASGALPDGLTLDAATGLVSGTPTRAGLVTFEIEVTDAAMVSASVSCSITIAGSVVITLLGWKLYPESPCGDAVEAIDLPAVKRAV